MPVEKTESEALPARTIKAIKLSPSVSLMRELTDLEGLFITVCSMIDNS